MRKTGRNSLLQKFQRFNLSEVPPKVRTKAENIFRKFTEDEVRKTSAGAASFFVWVSNSRAIEKGKVFVRVLIFFINIKIKHFSAWSYAKHHEISTFLYLSNFDIISLFLFRFRM